MRRQEPNSPADRLQGGWNHGAEQQHEGSPAPGGAFRHPVGTASTPPTHYSAQTDPSAHFAKALTPTPGLTPLWDTHLLEGSTCLAGPLHGSRVRRHTPHITRVYAHDTHTHTLRHAHTARYCRSRACPQDSTHCRSHACTRARTHTHVRTPLDKIRDLSYSQRRRLKHKPRADTGSGRKSLFVGAGMRLGLEVQAEAPSSPWSLPASR